MKLSKFFVLSSVLFAIVLVFSFQAHAALQNLGVDSAGNRLIYDTDLDITWYDYTYMGPAGFGATWQNQVNWASNLSVDFGGNIYDDWRMPTTTQPDPDCTSQYDPPIGRLPPQSSGYNCTGSEMGHLYYTELGNTAGRGGFTNTGDFQNLQPFFYWLGTEYAGAPGRAWYFYFNTGGQSHAGETFYYSALAVRPGLAVASPIPNQ